MIPEEGRQARANRYERHRRRRSPLPGRAAAIAAHPVVIALPVHRLNPAWQTLLGLAEIVAFVVVIVTASPVALVVLFAALAAFLGTYALDTRAVIALESDVRGSLLAAGKNGRPNAVMGPATLSEPLPSAPAGLSTPIRLETGTWWLDRSSYPALSR